MQYDEEPRAINVLSGLALGLAVGAGIGILLSLDRRVSPTERALRRARSARDQAARHARRWGRDLASRVPVMRAGGS